MDFQTAPPAAPVLPVAATTTEVLTGTDTAEFVTPDANAATWEMGTPVAAAATLTLGEGGVFHITGTGVSITDIDFQTPKDGRLAWLIFDSAGNTLVHNATTLKLPGGSNIGLDAGGRALIMQDSGDNIVVLVCQYQVAWPTYWSTIATAFAGVATNQAISADVLAAFWEKGTAIASAATITFPDTGGGYFHITGTVTITDIDWATAKDGRWAWVYFDASLTLTHNATTLALFGSNIVTQPGDTALFIQDAADNVVCVTYNRASGKPNTPPTAAEVPFTPAGNIAATNVQAAIAEVESEVFGYRNKLINGDFSVDQQNRGGSVTNTGPASSYVPDRWFCVAGQAPGAFAVQRTVDGTYPDTFVLMITSTVADASLTTTDYYMVGQIIEGSMLRGLLWGTASAKPITLSFILSASGAFTLPISIRNGANNRSWVGSVAISGGRQSITIPGDTTGSWNTDEAAGLQLFIGLGVGPSYVAPASGWNAGNFLAPPGPFNFMGAVSNQLYLENWQLEEGSVATPFERIPYDLNLMRCRRYLYYKMADVASERIATGYVYATNNSANVLRLPVKMRATPALIAIGLQANGLDLISAAGSQGSDEVLGFNVAATGLVAGQGVYVGLKTAGVSFIKATAEY